MDKIVGIFLSPIPNDEAIGALFSSLIVMVIMVILSIIISIMARRQDPLKKPKGLLLLAEIGVNYFDGQVEELMGRRFKGFGSIIMCIAVYIVLSFLIGLTGLPSPLTNLATPLSLGLVTFVLIHATAVRFNKWKYFKRYVDPFPFFLPINLLSMWSPLLSLSLRLFGNALAGWTLMSVVYYALESVSAAIFSMLAEGLNTIFIAPLITWILHAYFDLFSGVIQTLVFIILTMLFVANEAPDEDEMQEKLSI